MVEQLDDVWADRDFPVLVEVTRRIDQGEHAPRTNVIAAALEMSTDQVSLAGRALKRRGLVDVQLVASGTVTGFKSVSGEAYTMTGLHPDGDDAVSQLISALRQAADQASNTSDKSKLRAAADQFAGLSRDVAAGVLTSVITAAGRGMLS